MRLLFIGTGDIGLPTLRALFASPDHNVLACVTQPDKPAGRHQELHVSAVKELALQNHARIFQPAKIRERGAVEQLQFLRPDVIVVMAYGQILPGEILRIPAVACLNLHASLLPRHRGASPIHAAIEAGDATTGITVMYMDEGLDTGDVLLQKEIEIRRRETAGTLHDRLAALAPEALSEALSLLKQGRAPRTPQDSSHATYAPKLGREHGEIVWRATHEEVDRKVRAMNPWPGAFTLIPGAHGTSRKLKVFSCIQHSRVQGQPGEVLRTDKNGILVAAGCGAVLLREVQPEGKRRMPAEEFVRGNPIVAGSLLGAPRQVNE